MYEEGHYLAVLNPEGSFYVCQALQDIPFKSKKKFKIRWLEEVSTNMTYKKLHGWDLIQSASVIDEVILAKVAGNKFVLSQTESVRIKNLIDITNEQKNNEQKNDNEPTKRKNKTVKTVSSSTTEDSGNKDDRQKDDGDDDVYDDDDDDHIFLRSAKRVRTARTLSPMGPKTPEQIHEPLSPKPGPSSIDQDCHPKPKRRTYEERHSCYFCHKIVNKMSKHLINMHSDEMEVAKILSHPKNSRERKIEFDVLRNAGDYYYNCEVLSTKDGELILLRKSNDNNLAKNYNEFGPCPHCLGFMLKKLIWHHIKHSCAKKDTGTSRKLAMAESRALLHSTYSTGTPGSFVKNVLDRFRGKGQITDICKSDKLIIRFGLLLWDKHEVTQCELIRQSMRQLARLLIECKKSKSEIKQFSDCLVPANFDILIESVKRLCCQTAHETQRPTLENAPSLALKLGHNLRKCSNIERSYAIKEGNTKKNQEMTNFLHLMDLEWSTKVSSIALSSLRRKKYNTAQLIPIASDLVKLNKFICTEIESKYSDIKHGPFNEKSWLTLAKACMARLLIFNKRRSGETAKMTVAQYEDNPNWAGATSEEALKTLTQIERQLIDRLKLVNVVGKRERKVPIIITPDCKRAIGLLIQTRDKVKSISRENPYVFPSPSQNNTHIRGDRCLRKFCEQVKLERPDLITGTDLRRYMATVVQIFDLNETESDWLARHLGHDIRVHREFYRMQEAAVELTKISRLLMVVNEGKASDFAGKPLGDIQLEEKRSKKKEKSIQKKTQWVAEEKKLVLSFFRNQIKAFYVPGKQECEECIKVNSTHLKKKSWRDVKYCVYNHIASLKRKIKSK